MRKIHWSIKNQASSQEINRLKLELPTLNEDSLRLLLNRKINSLESARLFFNPEDNQLHDPFLMKDMGVAVEILSQHVAVQDKIILYGDYDVDGSCSVALAYSFLKKIGANCEYYIPDRYSEGYGLSDLGVTYAIENNVKLMVTMDCGIRSVSQIQLLKNAGVEVIICDHHEPGSILPKADAVLDAKQEDCFYPYKELCGCGVVFKLLHAFCLQQGVNTEELFQYVDLLALATCADIVPMTGENRVFVRLGLEKVNKNPSLGLAMLKQKASFDGVMNVRGLVFVFAPRINAAGRIYHAKAAVELLIAEDQEYARTLADKIDIYNQERRVLDKEITESALEIIRKSDFLINKKTTVLADSNWHKGVVGIVASRCIEQYHRPTIIFKETDGYLTGSARSVGNFDVLKAIEKCDYLLDKYGGHKFAAGLSLPEENFDAFCAEFEKQVASTIDPLDLQETISIEQEIDPNRINFNFYHLISRLEPFGPQNMQPIFLSKKITLKSLPILLKEEHLKFSIDNKQGSIDCIGFGMKEEFAEIDYTKEIDIAYTIEINEYMSTKKLQLMLKAVRQSESYS